MDSGLITSLLENMLKDITNGGDLQDMVKSKIISPLLQCICKELYPYFYIFAGVVVLVVTLLVIVTIMLISQFMRYSGS